jgi:hypothetical protein
MKKANLVLMLMGFSITSSTLADVEPNWREKWICTNDVYRLVVEKDLNDPMLENSLVDFRARLFANPHHGVPERALGEFNRLREAQASKRGKSVYTYRVPRAYDVMVQDSAFIRIEQKSKRSSIHFKALFRASGIAGRFSETLDCQIPVHPLREEM